MKRLVALNICTIIFSLFLYLANYLLLRDNFFHISISSIISCANQLHGQIHLLVLALLPIYIATVIFGASILGLYIGRLIQQAILKHENRKIALK